MSTNCGAGVVSVYVLEKLAGVDMACSVLEEVVLE